MSDIEGKKYYTEHDLARIRNSTFIKELWKRCFDEGGFKGRTWGRKKKGDTSPLRGSHITQGQLVNNEETVKKEKEMVILNISHDGKLLLHEFISTRGTKLGNEIRSWLEQEGEIVSEE